MDGRNIVVPQGPENDWELPQRPENGWEALRLEPVDWDAEERKMKSRGLRENIHYFKLKNGGIIEIPQVPEIDWEGMGIYEDWDADELAEEFRRYG